MKMKTLTTISIILIGVGCGKPAETNVVEPKKGTSDLSNDPDIKRILMKLLFVEGRYNGPFTMEVGNWQRKEIHLKESDENYYQEFEIRSFSKEGNQIGDTVYGEWELIRNRNEVRLFHGKIFVDDMRDKKIPLTFLRVEKNGDLTEVANGWNQYGEAARRLLKLGEEDKGVKNVTFKDKRNNYAPEYFTTFKRIKSKGEEEFENIRQRLEEQLKNKKAKSGKEDK